MKIMKIMLSILCFIVLIISFAGCKPVDYEVERVATYEVGSEPYSYSICIAGKDLKVEVYDITSYGLNNVINDPIGLSLSSREYLKDEYTISQDEWDNVVSILEKNRFMDMSSNLDAENVRDGGAYYIEVTLKDKSHTVGGREPRYLGKEGQRFMTMFNEIGMNLHW